MTAVTIRPSEPSDIPAITRIYTHHVLNGTASFEEEAPGEPEMADRRAAVLDAGFPYIVAERDGAVVGYAYLGKYRPRSAYRYTVENSIYIAHDAIRQGIGRALLGELLRIAEAGPWQQMMAVISDPKSGSEALHAAFGFEKVGHMARIGYKFDQWIDVIVLQRSVG
ncbi:MAG: GNAT family N-acetyltransferase [Thalassobaculaceae bacterium]|nr:GNAT family N-acetyltransferase [Thalassobaculaceae bacterium]